MVGHVYNQMNYNYTGSPTAQLTIKNKLLCAVQCARQFATCNTAVFDTAVVPQCLLFSEPLIPAQLVVFSSAVVYDFQRSKFKATTTTANILTTTTNDNTTVTPIGVKTNTTVSSATTTTVSTAATTAVGITATTTAGIAATTTRITTATTAVSTTATTTVSTTSTTTRSTTTTTRTSTSTTTTKAFTTTTTTVTVSLSLYGVQTNLSTSSLPNGWSLCYNTTYATVLYSPDLATILTLCSKSKLLLGCRPVGGTVLTVAAMGNRADVIYNCANTTNCTHAANGVGWYFSDSYSWGFANGEDVVNRYQCDIESTNATYRLCWHTYGGLGGFRCGATTWLNSDASWERIIYHGS